MGCYLPCTGHIAIINLHRHLDGSPTSPRNARVMVRDALASCREIDVRDTAELLTSELVTNALLHAGTDVTVHVEDHGSAVRIGVEDGSDDEPTLGELDSIDLGGRGLPLVAAMAQSWGWEPLPHGKLVWFEV